MTLCSGGGLGFVGDGNQARGHSGVSVKRGKHSVEREKTHSAVWLVLEGVIRGSGKTAMTTARFGGDREQMQEQRR